MQKKKFFSAIEAAKLTGISRVAVFQNIKKGNLKSFQVGRGYVISYKDLKGFMNKRQKKIKSDRISHCLTIVKQ